MTNSITFRFYDTVDQKNHIESKTVNWNYCGTWASSGYEANAYITPPSVTDKKYRQYIENATDKQLKPADASKALVVKFSNCNKGNQKIAGKYWLTTYYYNAPIGWYFKPGTYNVDKDKKQALEFGKTKEIRWLVANERLDGDASKHIVKNPYFYLRYSTNKTSEEIKDDSTYYYKGQIHLDTPTKSGMHFKHWKLKNDFLKYKAGQTFTSGTIIPVDTNIKKTATVPSATFEAVWYNEITYKNSDGTKIATDTKDENITITLRKSGNKPADQKAGMSVIFDGNGGTVGGETTKKVAVYNTISYSLSKWKTSNGTTYNPGASYSTNLDLTLTADYTSAATNPTINLNDYTATKPAENIMGGQAVYTFNYWSKGSTKLTGKQTITQDTTFLANYIKTDNLAESTLEIDPNYGTKTATITVKRNGTTLNAGDKVKYGDTLIIICKFTDALSTARPLFTNLNITNSNLDTTTSTLYVTAIVNGTIGGIAPITKVALSADSYALIRLNLENTLTDSWYYYNVGDKYKEWNGNTSKDEKIIMLDKDATSTLIPTGAGGTLCIPKRPGYTFIGFKDADGSATSKGVYTYKYNEFACELFKYDNPSGNVDVVNLTAIFERNTWMKSTDGTWKRIDDLMMKVGTDYE